MTIPLLIALTLPAIQSALTNDGVPDPAITVLTGYAGMIDSTPVMAQPLASKGCVEPPALIAQGNGVFNDLAPIRLASVSDGLSNTTFMAQKGVTILLNLPHSGVWQALSARTGGEVINSDFY